MEIWIWPTSGYSTWANSTIIANSSAAAKIIGNAIANDWLFLDDHCDYPNLTQMP